MGFALSPALPRKRTESSPLEEYETPKEGGVRRKRRRIRQQHLVTRIYFTIQEEEIQKGGIGRDLLHHLWRLKQE